MTIASEDRLGGPFTGTNNTGPFVFDFVILSAEDVYVEKILLETGEREVLTLSTDYTVSLNANQDLNPGGSITLLAALAPEYKIAITSDTPITQNTNLQNSGGFFSKDVTKAFDRLTILIQELKNRASRSFLVPIDEDIDGAVLPNAATRANKVLSFDADGDPEAVITKDQIINAQANAEAALAQATLAIAAANTATAAANAAVIAASGVNEIGSLKLYPSNTPNIAPFAHWLPLYDTEYEVLKSAYPLLYQVAVTHLWAKDGSTSAYFVIPSLHGYVIRIIDKTATNDPDAASRSAFTGGTGNLPFSKQDHALQQHTHQVWRGAGGESDDANDRFVHTTNEAPQSGGVSGANVSSETRMKNAAFAAYIVAKLPST